MNNKISIITTIYFCLFHFYNLKSQTISAKVDIDDNGNVFVEEHLENVTIGDTILLDKRAVINSGLSNSLGYLYEETSDLLNDNLYKRVLIKSDIAHTFYHPQRTINSYFLSSSTFVFTLNYLASPKNQYKKIKKIELEIHPPKNFEVIYPSQNEFSKGFYYSPAIIAGNFDKKSISGFDVYIPDGTQQKNLNKLMRLINGSYEYYDNLFGKRNLKPKIIFVPFSNGLGGKAIDNALLLDTNLLKKIDEKLIYHEIAHFWWGLNGKKFSNSNFNEGVTEYLALHYMQEKKIKNLLAKTILIKNYETEGIKSYSLFDKDSTISQKTQKYHLIPLLLWEAEKRKENVIQKIVKLYKDSSNNILDNEKAKSFFKSINISTENIIFLDYRIRETQDKIIVELKDDYLKDEDTDMYVVITENDQKKYVKRLIFNLTNKRHAFGKDSISKMSIDPKFHRIQYSSLNDVWNNDNSSSMFKKNKYFPVKDLETPPHLIANAILKYIFRDETEVMNYVKPDGLVVKAALNKMNRDLFKKNITEVDGASFLHIKRSNIINIQFLYVFGIKQVYVKLEVQLTDNDLYIQKIAVSKWIASQL